MFFRYLSLFLFFLLLFNLTSEGQTNPEKNKNDSARVYKEIQTFSKKRGGFVTFIHGLLFRPVVTDSKKVKKNKSKSRIQKPHKVFEGKIIRDIDIQTLDPFGYSTTDSTLRAQNIIYKAGNHLHVKSQVITIRNLLLFRKYDVYDSLRIKESERLIRSQTYVQEVALYSTTSDRNSDSVDIIIRVLDKWSIIPGIAASPTRLKLELKDINLLGFGHTFDNAFTWNHSNGKNAFNTSYLIPNIKNTYINALLSYSIDDYKNYSKVISIDRPFYSTFANWAGGIYFDQQFHKDSIYQPDSTFATYNTKYNTQDYWTGYAQKILKGNSEDERSTDLIYTLRYLRRNYVDKPAENFNKGNLFTDEDFYLAGIGISKRKYVQDKYIFNYGFIEDVPVGNVLAITGGYQIKKNTGRLYAGTRLSFGTYSEYGYISTSFEYGTFFRSSKIEQGVFSARINYFTDIIEIGRWKIRQFIKPQFSLGINRQPLENININEENGIRGFDSKTTAGTKKIVLTLQTQSYAPWNLIGFRFGPYLILSAGLLGDSEIGFTKSKLYSQIGLGVLIKNEFLVFSNFQLSVSFYPQIPDDGYNIIKMNQDKTSDFGFQDFLIGKPDVVQFK